MKQIPNKPPILEKVKTDIRGNIWDVLFKTHQLTICVKPILEAQRDDTYNKMNEYYEGKLEQWQADFTDKIATKYEKRVEQVRAEVLKEVGEKRLSEGDIQLLIVAYNFKASQYGEDLSELIKASERRFKENLEALKSGTMPERRKQMKQIEKPPVLSGEFMSEQIQIKTKKWSVVNPEFIEDIANIIAEAQRGADHQWAITDYRAEVLKEVDAIAKDLKESKPAFHDYACLLRIVASFLSALEALKSGTVPERSEG